MCSIRDACFYSEYQDIVADQLRIRGGGGKGVMPPPLFLSKLVIKNGCHLRRLIFHVSSPPLLDNPGSDAVDCQETLKINHLH